MSQRFDPKAHTFAPSQGHSKTPILDGVKTMATRPHQTQDFNQAREARKGADNRPQGYVEARINALKEEHETIRGQVGSLNRRCDELSASIDELKGEESQSSVDIYESLQVAAMIRSDLYKSSREARLPIDEDYASSTTKDGDRTPMLEMLSVTSEASLQKSLPPHLRGRKTNKNGDHNGTSKDTNNTTGLGTNGKIPNGGITNGKAINGNAINEALDLTVSTYAIASPVSSNGTEHQETWKPFYLTTLPTLNADIQSKIPGKDTITFHPDFIHNNFEGLIWSPGLRFIPGTGACLLKDRTYYLLDPKDEPFLPERPGAHGAKLTPFFNVAPEDEFDNIPPGLTSTEHVPVFVAVKDSKGRTRYAYYGDYSQTRWSDKIGYDTMMTKVPLYVKEFWAKELTSKTRAEWITKALKNHFFKMPEYEGRLFAAVKDEDRDDAAKKNDKMEKDMKKYAEELRDWEREADMKVSMITKEFIMQAFDRADADEPPALRLWWEYMECVDWNAGFYNLIVQLQSRDAKRYLE
ncbi:hypothetical protein IQ07DRAFT_110783 [Pyrenochaeta sp. DS3sAY3a]|nr:hypothetical protein IQ07DRAFT_110783 [Pyrenochaeta sp. DS3sAY3a]